MADKNDKPEGYEFDEEEVAAGDAATAREAARLEALRQSDPAAYEAEIKKLREWSASLKSADTPAQPTSQP